MGLELGHVLCKLIDIQPERSRVVQTDGIAAGV